MSLKRFSQEIFIKYIFLTLHKSQLTFDTYIDIYVCLDPY